MKLNNCRILTPDKEIRNAEIVYDETVRSISKRRADKRNTGEDYTLIPGLVETHMHGCMGEDFSFTDENGLKKIETFLYQHGVTSVLATTLSISFQQMKEAVNTVRTYIEKHENTSLSGVHLEGPFFNAEKKGAQNPEFIRSPSREEIDFICDNSDLIKLITLAPEVEGNQEALKRFVEAGITVSIGHTTAGYEKSINAVQSGASRFTHLFNGMKGIHHRDVGTAGAGLLSNAHVEIIADLIHLSPETIQLIVRQKKADKIVLITDAMEATGLEPGEYKLGGLSVTVSDEDARLKDGSLAGSILTMDTAIRNMVKVTGFGLKDVARFATLNPSISTGLNAGLIEIGLPADFVVLNKDLSIQATVKSGEVVYGKRPAQD